MTPQLLQSIQKLVRAGAMVVGPRPLHSPSLAGYPNCDLKVKQLADELWGKCDGTSVFENSYGKGLIIWGKSLTDVFAARQLKPDFEFAGPDAAAKLTYVHRVAGKTDIYFVSNQRQQFDSAECTFRVTGKIPELWHPDTGVIEPAPLWSDQDGRTKVRLNFDPSGSTFVIFRRASATTDHITTASSTIASESTASPKWETIAAEDGSSAVKVWHNGQIDLRTARGQALRASADDLPEPKKITGPWNLNFPPNWGAPASVPLDELISWTDHSQAGVRYFSGTATYEKDIEIPAERLSVGRELWLDLGEVKNFAEVSLNGHNLGVLWKPPFGVNITTAAKPGVNHLTVKVTNLWPNRLIGDEQLPPDAEWNNGALKSWPQWLLDGKPSPTGRLTFTTWHYWTRDSKLLESGLLGPVTLRTAEIIPAK